MREDPESVKAKIIEAFIMEFNADGTKLNLDNVAKRIHISKKTIYRYFSSKTDIYNAIIDGSHRYVHQRQKEIYESEGKNPEEKLFEILTIETPFEAILDFNRVFEVREYEPLVYHQLVKSYSDQWVYPLMLIEEGKRTGWIRKDVNPTLVIAYLTSSMNQLYSQDLLQKAGVTYKEAINHLARCIVAGIKAR